MIEMHNSENIRLLLIWLTRWEPVYKCIVLRNHASSC